ncbi:MAG: DUF2007 domain-containing protein [Treponema sp.]|nr:DUF2007 domain-containing protein [Treponema sp.]
MRITLIIFILVAIFGFLLYNKYVRKDRNIDSQKKDDKNTDKKEGEDLPDFEKGFFERTQAGEKSQLLLTLASQQDCAIIRSLLQAENIPSYTEGEHMNNIYGGLSGTMTTVVAIKLYILCADYDKAVDIIKNYKMDSSGYTIFDKVE